MCFALGAAALARVREFRGRDGVRLLLRLAAAAAVTLAVLFVVLRPYVRAGHQRPPAVEAAELATALSSYLASSAKLHYESWSGSYYHSAPGTLFPGVVTLALAGVAVLRRRSAAPRGTRRMLVAVAGAGCLMSLGSLTPVYAWAYDLVPPLQGLRAIHRFRGVGYVVVHTGRYPGADRFRQELDRLDRRRDLVLEITDGATRLYRVRGEKSRGVAALNPAPALARLRFVDGPAGGSVLRAAGGLRRAFGFQSPERFIAYMEATTSESHLMLRLPVPMSGRFLDAATGAGLQEVTVPVDTGPPVRVPAPPGRAGVILDLHAR